MYQVLRDMICALHVTVVKKKMTFDFHPIYGYFRSAYGYYPMVNRVETGWSRRRGI